MLYAIMFLILYCIVSIWNMIFRESELWYLLIVELPETGKVRLIKKVRNLTKLLDAEEITLIRVYITPEQHKMMWGETVIDIMKYHGWRVENLYGSIDLDAYRPDMPYIDGENYYVDFVRMIRDDDDE